MNDLKKQDKIIIFIGIVTIIIIMVAIFIKAQIKNTNNDISDGKNTQGQISTTTKNIDKENVNVYKNTEYGFQFILLDSWKNYSILSESWEGELIGKPENKFHGPKIILRNPKWSDKEQWQDIPILLFNKEQWQLVQTQSISLGAAPIGPSKLGENDKYVFALPARWLGFTDNRGQNEANEIVKTFKAFN